MKITLRKIEDNWTIYNKDRVLATYAHESDAREAIYTLMKLKYALQQEQS